MESNFYFYRSLRESKEKWEEYSGSYIKGYAFNEGMLLKGTSLLDALVKSIKNDTLDSFLSLINGNYGAIILLPTKVILISDKIRSYPLLYTVRDKVYCADSGESAKKLFSDSKIAKDAEREFAALGYLSDGLTLVDNINYVNAGEYVTISGDGKIKRTPYHSFSCEKKGLTKREVYKGSQKALDSAFERTITSIGEYSNILIPLSGGYDSRLVACLCKKAGFNNVICYTYGKKDSFEVLTSKKVAETLGYRWEFVEYDKEVWDATLNSEIFHQYIDFSGCLTAAPHIQDFPALLSLKKRGIIDSDTVIVPGHSGDLLGGSKIPIEIIEDKRFDYNKKALIDLLYEHFFELNKLKNNYEEQEKNRIAKVLDIENQNKIEPDHFLDLYECEWFNKTRISNFIVNSMRAYEFIGVRWRLPLWDDEYAAYWYKLPWKKKYNSDLYNQFMFDVYFKPYGVDFKKENITAKSFVKSCMKKILPMWLKKYYREAVAEHNSSVNKSHFNAFEHVNSFIEEKLDRKDFDYIKEYNHGNINALTSLSYINHVKRELI